jgi:predicted secreted hydrolase
MRPFAIPWSVLLLVTALGPAEGWKRIAAPLTTSFPRDHGSHDEYRTEWWYATGIVHTTDAARRFGWQLTFFRQGVQPGEHQEGEPLLDVHDVFAAHLAIVDLQTHALVHSERIRRRVPELADASALDLDVRLDGWTMQRHSVDTGPSTISASALDRDTGTAIDLSLRPIKPLVLHGSQGVSVKGAENGNASAYVSWTRLATSGTLVIGGETLPVEGEAWFDHEWGTTQLGAGVVGWEWFGVHLDDGRDLMCYRLRRADGSTMPQSSGTLVDRDGKVQHLDSSEIRLVPTQTWVSPHTQAAYPSHWHLEVPKRRIDLQVVPMAQDCEIDARGSTGNVYWEGHVQVTGSSGGTGYGELTGFAGSMEHRF